MKQIVIILSFSLMITIANAIEISARAGNYRSAEKAAKRLFRTKCEKLITEKIAENIGLVNDEINFEIPATMQVEILSMTSKEFSKQGKDFFCHIELDNDKLCGFLDKSFPNPDFIDVEELSLREKIKLFNDFLIPQFWSEAEKEYLKLLRDDIERIIRALNFVYNEQVFVREQAEITVVILDEKLQGVFGIPMKFKDDIKWSEKDGKVVFNISESGKYVIELLPFLLKEDLSANRLSDSFFQRRFSQQEFAIEVEITKADITLPSEYNLPTIRELLKKKGFAISNNDESIYNFEISYEVNQHKNEFGNFYATIIFMAEIKEKPDKIIWQKSRTYEQFSLKKLEEETLLKKYQPEFLEYITNE